MASSSSSTAPLLPEPYVCPSKKPLKVYHDLVVRFEGSFEPRTLNSLRKMTSAKQVYFPLKKEYEAFQRATNYQIPNPVMKEKVDKAREEFELYWGELEGENNVVVEDFVDAEHLKEVLLEDNGRYYWKTKMITYEETDSRFKEDAHNEARKAGTKMKPVKWAKLTKY